MTRWKVVLRPAAKKQYRVLEEGPKRDAAELIEDLAEDPTRIPGAIPMKGYANAYGPASTTSNTGWSTKSSKAPGLWSYRV